ncbi:MAG: PIG-L family deacetylase [Promethearchaeota archaeon]
MKVASVTLGEYGLPGAQYDKFKGPFLAKIRTRELKRALNIHGMPPENIHYFGYIDGFVPFNRKIVSQFANYLSEEKPNIIFGPEPIYTSYYHIDQVNTGKALYYCLNQGLIKPKPILYFYSTLSPNFYFGFKKKDLGLIEQLFACHKTQFWLINKLKWMY